VRNKVESDIVLAAFDLNKNVSIYNEDKQRFENYLNSQKLVRKLDAIFLIDKSGKLIMSTDRNKTRYLIECNRASACLGKWEIAANDAIPLGITHSGHTSCYQRSSPQTIASSMSAHIWSRDGAASADASTAVMA